MRRLRRATAAGEEGAETTGARLLREDRSPESFESIEAHIRMAYGHPGAPLPANRSIPQSDGRGDYQGC